MAQATFHFPRGFLWGTATASHQVEGNNTNNNWWAWEQQPGKIRNGDKSGAGLRLVGRALAGRLRPGRRRRAECPPLLDRMEPHPAHARPLGRDALDRYREMVRGLQERGMTAAGHPAPLHRSALAGRRWAAGRTRQVVELFRALRAQGRGGPARIRQPVGDDQRAQCAGRALPICTAICRRASRT